MRVFYSDRHRKRDARTELYGGELRAPFECPQRMDYILSELEKRPLGPVLDPRPFGLEPVLAVHDAGFISFLATDLQCLCT